MKGIVNGFLKGTTMSKTKSELVCAALSKIAFFNEFVFDDLLFTTDTKQEHELADLIIELDKFVLVLQIKERNQTFSNQETEEKWMKNTIFNDAISQLKFSISTLKNKKGLFFSNEYGQETTFNEKIVFPIVVFFNSSIKEYVRSYTSKSTGAKVNIFSYEDFEHMCNSIFLPIELLNYLEFRHKNFGNGIPDLLIFTDEQRIILSSHSTEETGDVSKEISAIDFFRQTYADYAYVLSENDLRGFKANILGNFRKSMLVDNPQYRVILSKILLLKRRAISAFINFYYDSLTYAKEKKEYYRRVFMTDDVVFLFCSHNDWNIEFQGLITDICRYRFKKKSCLSIHFFYRLDGLIDINWIYHEEIWKQIVEYDKLLTNNDPWEGTTERKIPNPS